MNQLSTVSPAQYEVLNMLSCITEEEDIRDLKQVIVEFLNTRLQKEIDKLWDEGKISEEILEEWRHEHMRTPYNRA